MTTPEPTVRLMGEPAPDLTALTDDELDALHGSVFCEQARRDPAFSPEFVARRVAEVMANERHPNAVRLRELDDALTAAIQAADDLLDDDHPAGCPCRLCHRDYGREMQADLLSIAGTLTIFQTTLGSFV